MNVKKLISLICIAHFLEQLVEVAYKKHGRTETLPY